jgi:Zn-dependent protease/predicted transcriptional regulator
MFVKKLRLFNIFGFKVKIDVSWFFIFALVTWSLASGFFPSAYKNLPTVTYWIMGFVSSVGLFISIVLHEFSHSIIARRYGIPMKGITLFLFGGVAEMEDEPPSPKAELSMAVAGPAMSIVLGLLFFGLSIIARNGNAPTPVFGVLRYIAFMNGMLAAFNFIPAFPLDGGRVLRSIIWNANNDLVRATKITSMIGRVFGFLLIGFGVISLFLANFIAGMWWFLIGLFLNNAARASYKQLLIKKALAGQKIDRFMKKNPVSVPSTISVRELVEDYIYQYHFKLFPVVEDGKLLGCVTTKMLASLPKSDWEKTPVAQITVSCSKDNSVEAGTDAADVLRLMSRAGQTRLMVTRNGVLEGVIALKDLLEYVSLRMELEQE